MHRLAMAIFTNTDVRLRFTLSLRKAPVPVSLVDATLQMTIKKTVDDVTPALVLDTDVGIEIVDPKRGVFIVHFSPAVTNDLGPGDFIFDIIRTDGGERAPIARGNFKIRKGVS